MYIDFHTHNLDDPTAEITLYCHANLSVPLPSNLNQSKLCFGLHPWYLPNSVEAGLEQLEEWEEKYESLGFGECGLDRLKGPDLEIQEHFLTAQLKWAEEKKKSFVVLHCVRCFPEIISILQKNLFSGKIVFHDYRANPEITKQLLSRKNVFFSVGSLLFLEKLSEKQNETLRLIPFSKLFLETDDSNQTIQSAYQKYAKFSQRKESEILSQIQKNFKSLTA